MKKQTELVVADTPKMVRETLCRAEVLISHRDWDVQFIDRDLRIISHLIDECDRHRPLGSDGKHGNRHTPTCGCEDVGVLDAVRAEAASMRDRYQLDGRTAAQILKDEGCQSPRCEGENK